MNKIFVPERDRRADGWWIKNKQTGNAVGPYKSRDAVREEAEKLNAGHTISKPEPLDVVVGSETTAVARSAKTHDVSQKVSRKTIHTNTNSWDGFRKNLERMVKSLLNEVVGDVAKSLAEQR